MLKLSGDDRRDLREALTSGFRSYSSLKIFVSDNFDFPLDRVATSQATQVAADNLIEHLEESGDVLALVLALHRERPRNPEVQKLMNRLQGFLQPVDNINRLRSQRLPTAPVSTSSFSFEIVKVNAQGEEIERHQARRVCQMEDLGHGVVLELVSIPGGSSMMGSPRGEKGRTKRESPQHEVKVPPFMMGRYPVTQSQWNVVSFLPKVNLELEANPAKFRGNSRPIECISWHAAVEFCNRLSCYTGREYRLPSEAEWEYACRAATTTPFHFGETIRTDEANYHGNYAYGSSAKGKYRQSTNAVNHFSCANAFGLSDMHGNVFEWCQDHWHENYDGAPTHGEAWIDGGDDASRVTRGGSWSNDPSVCRSAHRYQAETDNYDDALGFRVVVSILLDATAPR